MGSAVVTLTEELFMQILCVTVGQTIALEVGSSSWLSLKRAIDLRIRLEYFLEVTCEDVDWLIPLFMNSWNKHWLSRFVSLYLFNIEYLVLFKVWAIILYFFFHNDCSWQPNKFGTLYEVRVRLSTRRNTRLNLLLWIHNDVLPPSKKHYQERNNFPRFVFDERGKGAHDLCGKIRQTIEGGSVTNTWIKLWTLHLYRIDFNAQKVQ